jgi:hypothetical protein
VARRWRAAPQPDAAPSQPGRAAVPVAGTWGLSGAPSPRQTPAEAPHGGARPRGGQADARRRVADPRLLPRTTAPGAQAEPGSAVRTAPATPTGPKRAATLRPLVPVGPQGIPQTTRRSLPGAGVPAPAHVVRRCEPPTALMRHGQTGQPTACSRGIWGDAVEGGLLRRDAVLAGQPAEDAPRPPRLDHQRRGFNRPTPPRTRGRPPRLASRRWWGPRRGQQRPTGARLRRPGGAGVATTGAPASRAGSGG